MQTKGLHKNIYKLYAYARTQESLDAYRKKYEHRVTQWEKLKSQGVKLKVIQEFVGISRATYYRSRKVLRQLEKGIMPPSTKPKRVNKPRWGEAESQLALRLRRDNPTYGKEKLVIILKRDHNSTISESTVRRILKDLFARGLIQKSTSALPTKRKRNFKKGHAQA
jgi:putative transposase